MAEEPLTIADTSNTSVKTKKNLPRGKVSSYPVKPNIKTTPREAKVPIIKISECAKLINLKTP